MDQHEAVPRGHVQLRHGSYRPVVGATGSPHEPPSDELLLQVIQVGYTFVLFPMFDDTHTFFTILFAIIIAESSSRHGTFHQEDCAIYVSADVELRCFHWSQLHPDVHGMFSAISIA